MKTVSQHLLGEATRRLAEAVHPEEIWLFGSHASREAELTLASVVVPAALG